MMPKFLEILQLFDLSLISIEIKHIGPCGSARNDSSSVIAWKESGAIYGINPFEIYIPKTPELCLIINKTVLY